MIYNVGMENNDSRTPKLDALYAISEASLVFATQSNLSVTNSDVWRVLNILMDMEDVLDMGRSCVESKTTDDDFEKFRKVVDNMDTLRELIRQSIDVQDASLAKEEMKRRSERLLNQFYI
jgi:hypothetical protein